MCSILFLITSSMLADSSAQYLNGKARAGSVSKKAKTKAGREKIIYSCLRIMRFGQARIKARKELVTAVKNRD